ncbi:MAG: hypothetical protein ABEJ06_02440 [Haloarculaceae archaeon]
MSRRGQSSVVGVALLLGVTIVSLGLLTAGIGTVVADNAARADARRVAVGFDSALRPVEITGPYRGEVTFSEGSLRTVERDLRVLDGERVVERVAVGGLVFESGPHRTAYLAGGVVRGTGEAAWLATPPPVTASGRGDAGVLVVGAPTLGGTASVAGSGGVVVTLATNVSHDRVDLGTGRYRLAIETATPGAWERFFRERGATVSRRTFDGDHTSSVVATFPGRRRAYLVVHDLGLEVVS